MRPWSPLRKAKSLREKAIGLRLNAYYADGGVGQRSLTAGRQADELERQADELCPKPPRPASKPVSAETTATNKNLVACTCGIAPTGWSLASSKAGVYHRTGCPARTAFEERKQAMRNPVDALLYAIKRAGLEVDPASMETFAAWRVRLAEPVDG